MGFLSPAAFGLAALIPPIIAMYLLKLRRNEQVVSSVYLWQRMVRDVEANAPWQRLRRNLLLLLQLLFLAALILALARPFRWVQGASARATILILDTSASMAATDLTPNRLEAAKARAAQIVDNMSDDARVTLITAGQEAQVLVASSQDRRRIKLAIDEIQVNNGSSDLTTALELASAVAARQPATEIVVLSDGRVTLPERLSLAGHVRYLPMGLSGDNQAISSLSMEGSGENGEATAFAQITNYSQATAQRRLTFYADGQLVDAYDLEIAPGGQRAVVAAGLPAGAQVLEAQLTGQDSLPLDDHAWAVRPDLEPAAVTLVSDGNLFLETALALLPDIEVTSLRPEDFEQGAEVESVPDLTIFDAYVPFTTTLPAGNLLFVAPPRSTSYFTLTGTLDLPAPRLVDAKDPLLAYVDLTEANVLQAARIPLPAWARPVIAGDASGDSAPLLFAGQVDGRRVAALAFDLHSSDLPLQVAFPVLLANLTGWLAPGSGGELPGQVSPGAAVSLSLPPEVEAATLTRPDGSTLQLVPKSGQVAFADTGQLGLYRLAWQLPQTPNDAPLERQFAVDLFSPQESDVRPADELGLSGNQAAGQSRDDQQSRREWWRPLVLVALIFLVAEWLVYQRAALFRLWGQARQLVVSRE
jgi:Ca-activated chloride channel family protein